MTLRRVPVPPAGPRADTLAREAAAAIHAGELLALPTETVYGLAADPGSADSVDRVRALKDRPTDLIFTWHIADREDAEALVGPLPERVQRLVERYWPGPLTVVLPARDGNGTRGLRLPAHDFTRAVIRAFGGPLFLTSVNRSGENPLVDPAAIAERFADAVDRIYDAGPAPLQQASTVVRWRHPGELEVLREGTLSATEVHRAAARTVLFVCSGNTCRSPLAQHLARRAAARALGTTDDRVIAYGIDFASAGTTAVAGAPATENSIRAGHEVGVDLEPHLSTPLTAAAIRAADHVYCLAPAHLVAVRHLAPEHHDHVELLDPGGAGVPDPFGAELESYRQTRDVIGRAVDARIAELLGTRATS